MQATEVKACCAGAYASEAARWLLGERFHPGGAALTAQLLSALRVGPQSVALDLACGPGASSLQLVRESGCEVVGLDISPQTLAAARAAAELAGLEERTRFIQGDAEALPLEDASVDGVLCECALCTFPDKEAAAREIARVLRPGGRLALSDVTAEPARLPEELRSVHAWVACIADARPLEEIRALLAGAGLVVERRAAIDGALVDLLERVEARLRLARMLGDSAPGELRQGAERGLELVAAARTAAAEGSLGYGMLVALKPGAGTTTVG